MKKLIALLLIAGAAATWYWWQQRERVEVGPCYRTAPVTHGTLINAISATGVVKPIKEVEVGTQVNGRIMKLYVDFNATVTNNQIIALIDPDVYEAAHARDAAQLKSNEATVEQIAAKLQLAEKDLLRKSELANRKMLSTAELDAITAERDALAAQLKVAYAAVEQARAAIKLSRANLEYCTIRAPVNGVIIARNVDEGQTVVSSFNAQQLYQIATDLKRIQVEASIPEADIGQIKSGQRVTFTVDAYPHTFTGAVEQIRLAATTVQNVVTYPVIVEADNPEQKLFPGMTANIAIEVERQEDVQIVPAAALRFTPPHESSTKESSGVWLVDAEGTAVRQPVTPGITDHIRTAINEPTDLVGKEVAIGLQPQEKGSGGTTRNPFFPNLGDSRSSKNVRRLIR